MARLSLVKFDFGEESTYLSINDMLVDLAGCDVVIASKRDIEISFVVPQIQIAFRSVIQDIYFT
jgi:hypothetical protein